MCHTGGFLVWHFFSRRLAGLRLIDVRNANQRLIQLLDILRIDLDLYLIAEALISLVKDTINGNKEIKFSAFSNAKILELQSQFQEEVLEQWGNTESFREYKTMFSSHSKQIQEKEIESFYSMIIVKIIKYKN